jgi:MSHA biogenesis protein MshJ
MSPLDSRMKKDRTQAAGLQTELTDLSNQEKIIQLRKDFDPDLENRQLLSRLQAEMADVQRQLDENVVNLISPQEMPELLKDLLIRQQGLQLLSLENLPPDALRINEQIDEDMIPILYRHRLRVEFAGNYLATLKYLKKLDDLPQKMVWEELEIETLEYPRARVRLQVYTLSQAKGWIGG